MDKVDSSEIDLIWKQVQERVIRLAGDDPTKLRKNLNAEDVLALVDRAQAAQKTKSEKYGWFKSAVSRTLQCIQTVGGIVANAASQVSSV